MKKNEEIDNGGLAEIADDDAYIHVPVSADKLNKLSEELKSGPCSLSLTVSGSSVFEFTVVHPEHDHLSERVSEDEPIYTDIQNEDVGAKIYVDEESGD